MNLFRGGGGGQDKITCAYQEHHTLPCLDHLVILKATSTGENYSSDSQQAMKSCHSADNEDEERAKAPDAAGRGVPAALLQIQAQSPCY